MRTEVHAGNVECRSVGKSVLWGLVKSETASGTGMLDLGALDDTVVVWPDTANFPKPSTDAFRTVPVEGNWYVGLGSSGSTEHDGDQKRACNTYSPNADGGTMGNAVVAECPMGGSRPAAIGRKNWELKRKQRVQMKKRLAWRAMGLAHQKRLPTILKTYVSGAVLEGRVEQTIVLPANFHVGRQVGNNNKLKIGHESSTTSVSCVSIKTVEEMSPRDGVSNGTICAADEPPTDGCTNKIATKKPTQPCYIRQKCLAQTDGHPHCKPTSTWQGPIRWMHCCAHTITA